MRLTKIAHQHVQFIPEVLDYGILYISVPYKTALHKCACGCGQEVVTPLGPAEWSLRESGGNVTLYPSIGNWSFPCESHYFIRDSNIVWVGKMSKAEISRGRSRAQARRENYLQAANEERKKGRSDAREAIPLSIFGRLTKYLRNLWNGS